MSEISADLFKKIRRIQIQTTKLANDILAGAYRSVFKGRGMEFEEVREYVPGDEIRSIDWNVTARMNTPYIKNFREEREISVMLLVDISASTQFGTYKTRKSDYIAEIAAVIAFSAIKNNDKIGLILFSDIIEKYIPPIKGTQNVLRIIRELLAYTPQNRGTDLAQALAFLGKVEKRSGVCFLLSDFFSSTFEHELKIIAKKHDLIGLSITDPFEMSLPMMGVVDLTDLETGENITVDSMDPKVRGHIKQLNEKQIKEQEYLFAKVGGSFVDIRTNQPYLLPLKKFFKLRARKQR